MIYSICFSGTGRSVWDEADNPCVTVFNRPDSAHLTLGWGRCSVDKKPIEPCRWRLEIMNPYWRRQMSRWAEWWAITQCNVRQLIKSLRDDLQFISPHEQHQHETCQWALLPYLCNVMLLDYTTYKVRITHKILFNFVCEYCYLMKIHLISNGKTARWYSDNRNMIYECPHLYIFTLFNIMYCD